MFDNSTESPMWAAVTNQTDDYAGSGDVVVDPSGAVAPPLGPFPARPPMSAKMLKTLELINISKEMHKYVTPGIVGLGLIGNILSLLIFNRPFIRKSSAAVYFSALAVADSVALIQHISGVWPTHFYADGRPKLYDFSDILCKFMAVLFPFSLVWPAWLIVALTVERVVITVLPFKAKVWCTRRTALIIVIAISLFLFSYYTLTVVVHGVSTGKCDIKAYDEKWALDYGYWITLVCYTLVPSPLIILLNGAVIFKLTKARKLRKAMTGSTANKTPNNDVISKATIAAVTVSVTYFFLTLPSATLSTVTVMTNLHKTCLELWFVHYLALIMRTTNNAINFFLYLATYPKIRAEFVSMVTGQCCQHAVNENTQQLDMNSKVTEMSCVQDKMKGTSNPGAEIEVRF